MNHLTSMHATFRQLQLFMALAEAGSITGAARACHVTQPTVSMQLRDLADSVGLPLYNQFGKRLRLTEAGEALVSAAQSMSDEWAAFEQKINGLKGLTQGRLRISVVSTAKYFVPDILGTFCARYPLTSRFNCSTATACSRGYETIATICTSCRCRRRTWISSRRCSCRIRWW